MRLLKTLSLLVVAAPSMLCAQTYLPKAVRFEGAPKYKAADLLAVSGLKGSGGVTKPEIDAAVQRLADTGLFADTRYMVNGDALTVTLTPIGTDKTATLRYSNFVWWQPGELTPLVHARVPLFDGSVPFDGNLLDAVKQALVALLVEKGISGKVESMTSNAGNSALAVTISTPEIKIGDVKFPGASPGTAAEMDKVRGKLVGEDFDELSTRKELVEETQRIYRDDGYLDVSAEAGPRAAPRASGFARYEIDLSVTVHGDDLYHVSGVQLLGAPPVSNGELEKLLMIKAGDVASAYELRTAESRMEQPYRKQGYLDADVKTELTKDAATHRVGYKFTLVPGEVYHVASVTSAGLSAEQQAEFEKSFHVAPNAVFDEAVLRQVGLLNQKKAFSGVRLGLEVERNRKQHTVALTLQPQRTGKL